MDTIDVGTRHTVLNIAVPKSTADRTDNITLANGWLEALTIFWPPGTTALVGVRLVYQGTQILPWQSATAWILGDNERREYPVDMYTPGTIAVHTQNNDKLPHGVFLTFRWHTYTAPTVGIPAQLNTVVA